MGVVYRAALAVWWIGLKVACILLFTIVDSTRNLMRNGKCKQVSTKNQLARHPEGRKLAFAII